MFKITRNDISPALTRLIGLAQHPKPVLRAAGERFKSITEGNFNGGRQYRPTPWKARQDGTPSNLQQSNTLSRSLFIEVTDSYAKIGTPVKYAAIHQFGGEIKAKGGGSLMWIGADGQKHFAKKITMPARPFFPVLNNRLTPAAENLILASAQRELNKQAGAV